MQHISLFQRRWSTHSLSWLLCALIAASFVLPIVAHGMPALRHDWFLFRDRGDFFTSAWNTFGGWTGDGIGAPRPYPTDYLLIAANTVLVALFGVRLDLLIVLFLIGLSLARVGWLIAARFGAEPVGRAGAAIFFTFNPWVYSKVVAGHVFMVLACAALTLLILELSQRRPDERAASIFAILTLAQLQFFVIAVIVVVVWTCRRRRIIPVLTVVLIALPIIVGVAADQAALISIPYNLSWQTAQSVDPVQALILRGYFAKYAQGFPAFSVAALWCVFALAIFGTLITLRRRTASAIALAAAMVWLIVTGTKGYASGLYAYLVTHVPQSGLIRELYDLVGYSTICYTSLASAAAERLRPLQWLLFVAACAIALAWALDPPTQFWTSLQRIPRGSIRASANSRFALMPPFQPLRFDRVGSGLDPDAFPRGANITPLNTPQFTYPSDVALSRDVRTGDTEMLAALSVSDVIFRPWFSTDRGSLASQTTLSPQPSKSILLRSGAITNFRPELTIEPLPQASDFVADLGENLVWFSDVAGIGGPGVPVSWKRFSRATPLTPSNAAMNPRSAWVDVRIAFAFDPALGQAIGGALTMSHTAALQIRDAEGALVFVRGELVSKSGEVLAHGSERYEWIAIPRGVRAVLCKGECVVAAQGKPPVLPRPAAPAKQRPRSVTFNALAPWLAIGTVPMSGTALLRYNVRFDPHWIAVVQGHRLTHFKVAMLFNGWILPPNAASSSVILIETVAFVQFALQAAGILWTLGLLGNLRPERVPA